VTGEQLFQTLRLSPPDDPSRLAKTWENGTTDGIRTFVAFEDGALWLYRRCRDLGVDLASPRLKTLGEWLTSEARRATAGNLLVDDTAHQVVAILHDVGAPHVLLKGIARRRWRERMPYVAARSTADVDILVPCDNAWTAWHALRDHGYRHTGPPGARTVHHLPPLKAQAGVPVEIHTSTSRMVWPDDAWARMDTTAVEAGDGFRIPAPTELLWHAVAHGCDHRAASFRLRFWISVSAIVASGAPLDWDCILARLQSPEVTSPRRAAGWLQAALMLAGAEPPSGLTAIGPPYPLRRHLAWRLRLARRGALETRWGIRLREEATRMEAGLPPIPIARDATLPLAARRRMASHLARWRYRLWRGTARGPEG